MLQTWLFRSCTGDFAQARLHSKKYSADVHWNLKLLAAIVLHPLASYSVSECDVLPLAVQTASAELLPNIAPSIGNEGSFIQQLCQGLGKHPPLPDSCSTSFHPKSLTPWVSPHFHNSSTTLPGWHVGDTNHDDSNMAMATLGLKIRRNLGSFG